MVKKQKGAIDFFDEEGHKVTVDISEIKQILLEKDAVVLMESKLFFTRILQPKQHTQSAYTNQDLIHTYLLMNGCNVNFAYVLDS